MSFNHKHTPRTHAPIREDVKTTKPNTAIATETLRHQHQVLANLSKRSDELDEWVREHTPEVPVDRLTHALQIVRALALTPCERELEMYTKLHEPLHTLADVLVDKHAASPCTLYLTALHHMRLALSLALSGIELPEPVDINKAADEFATVADLKHATATYPHSENTQDDTDPA